MKKDRAAYLREYAKNYTTARITFRKDSREHVYRLQVAANRDHLKAGGAIDRRTGQLKSSPHPYDPLELE